MSELVGGNADLQARAPKGRDPVVAQKQNSIAAIATALAVMRRQLKAISLILLPGRQKSSSTILRWKRVTTFGSGERRIAACSLPL